jgi:hypothetical protein
MADIRPKGLEFNEPNFAGRFQAVDPGRTVSPAGILLEGAGNLFGQSVAYADAGVKQAIKNDVSAVVDIGREADTANLEFVREQAGVAGAGLSFAAPDEASEVTDVSSQSKPPPPQAVGAGVSTAEKLTTANQARRMGDTEYYNRMTALAKQLKSRYPSYSEEVDAEFSRLLGTNPANAYRRALQNDIAAAQAGANATDKWLDTNSKYVQTIWPGSTREWQKQNLNEVQHRVDMYKSHEFQVQSSKSALELKKARGEDTEADALKVANQTAEIESRAFLEGGSNMMGLNAVTQQVTTTKPTPEKIEEWTQTTAALKQRASMQIRQRLADPSYNRLSGKQKEEIVANAVKPFDDTLQLLQTGDAALAKTFARFNTMRENADQRAIQDANPMIRNLTAVLSKLGPAGQVVAQKLLQDHPTLLPSLLDTMNHNLADVVTNPNPPTLNTQYERLVKEGRGAEQAIVETVKRTLGLVMNPSVPPDTAAKALRTLWDEQFFKRVADAKGEANFLSQLVSPGLAKRVEELSKTDPTIAASYQKFVSYAATTIFSRQLSDVGALVRDRTARFDVGFDPKTGQLFLHKTGVGKHASASAPEIQHVTEMNRTLRHLMPAFSINGEDPIPKLLGWLEASKAQPGQAKDPTMWEKVRDAVIKSLQPTTPGSPKEPSPVRPGKKSSAESPVNLADAEGQMDAQAMLAALAPGERNQGRAARMSYAAEGGLETASHVRMEGIEERTEGVLERANAALRDLPLKIVSAYRDPGHNRRVGGARQSQHQHGKAIDISLKGLSDADKQRVVEHFLNDPNVGGFGYYPNSDSIHIDTRDDKTAWGGNRRSNSIGKGWPSWMTDKVNSWRESSAGMTDISAQSQEHNFSNEPLNRVEKLYLSAFNQLEKLGVGGTALRIYNDIVQRGRTDPVTENDFNEDELKRLKTIIQEKISKDGKTTGSFDYKNYLGSSDSGVIDSFRNILGGFKYKVEDDGTIVVTDTYDFNKLVRTSKLDNHPVVQAILGPINPVGLATHIARKKISAESRKGVPVEIRITPSDVGITDISAMKRDHMRLSENIEDERENPWADAFISNEERDPEVGLQATPDDARILKGMSLLRQKMKKSK